MLGFILKLLPIKVRYIIVFFTTTLLSIAIIQTGAYRTFSHLFDRKIDRLFYRKKHMIRMGLGEKVRLM